MQKLETTLKFLEKTQNEVVENQKEYMKTNEAKFKEILDKIDTWVCEANKNYAAKWVEKDFTNLKEKLDTRNYDWLKYAIMTAVSILISVIVVTFK